MRGGRGEWGKVGADRRAGRESQGRQGKAGANKRERTMKGA